MAPEGERHIDRELTRESEAAAGAMGTRRPLLRVARLLLLPSGILASRRGAVGRTGDGAALALAFGLLGLKRHIHGIKDTGSVMTLTFRHSYTHTHISRYVYT